MFQISTSAAPKAVVSTLTALAAIGASGMLAEGAVVELKPTSGAYGTNSYMGTGHPDHWKNWLDPVEGVTYQNAGPAFVSWSGINFGDSFTSAGYRINANGSSSNYGIPAGATFDFSLITEPWSAATPDTSSSGPDYGTNTDAGAGPVTLIHRVTPVGGDQDLDITPLLLTWQASPTTYYGVRLFVSAGVDSPRGGIVAPFSTEYGDPLLENVTGMLILNQAATPEPTSLAFIGVGAILGLRRRRQ